MVMVSSGIVLKVLPTINSVINSSRAGYERKELEVGNRTDLDF